MQATYGLPFALFFRIALAFILRATGMFLPTKLCVWKLDSKKKVKRYYRNSLI